MLSAITSLPQAFNWAKDFIYAATGSPAKAKLDAPNGEREAVPLEAAIETARKLAPGARQILLQVPSTPGRPIELFAIERSAPHDEARSYLYVDPGSGEILACTPYEQSSIGSKFYFWTFAIHTGEAGGLPLRILLFLGAISLPLLAFTGLRSYLGTIAQRRAATLADRPDAPTLAVNVTSIRDETDKVKRFVLSPVGDEPLPPGTPGGHIDVHLGDGLVRQYSLTNGPQETDGYAIAVRRSPDSRGGSERLHTSVKVGDMLAVSAPRNHFPLEFGAKHHLLIAGGIGITPLISMAKHLQAGGSSFRLEYFVRNQAQAAFRDDLECPEFRDHVRFHEQIPPEKAGEYLMSLGIGYQDGAHAYVCGGNDFIRNVEVALGTAWPADHIHHEHFSADPTAWSAHREAFEVVLARSGRSFTVPADRTILERMAELGIPTVYSCAQGVCGTCLTRVLEGRPDHHDAFLSDKEKAAGDRMLLCVSRALGRRLVLDL